MKYRLLGTMVTALLLTTACGSDNEDNPPPPPVTIDIDTAKAIALTLTAFDGATGVLSFSLNDAEKSAITNAKSYSITYFGFPDSNIESSVVNTWKRWYVTHVYQCDASSKDCEGLLTEGEVKGSYQFEALGLDWARDAADGAVAEYKVAIEVHGALASNELELHLPQA